MRLHYTAVGIQNVSRMALVRDDYMKDIDKLALSMRYAVWNCSLDLPVKLVAVSEGGIGGWCLGGLRMAAEHDGVHWASSRRNSAFTSLRKWWPKTPS